MQYLETLGHIAPADMPLARMDGFVARFAQPLTEIGDLRIHRVTVNHDTVLFRHAPGKPACTRRATLRHGGIGLHEGVALGYDLVNIGSLNVLAAVSRDGLVVHLVHVNEYYVGFLHANLL